MECTLDRLTRYSPLSEYRAIAGTFSHSHGLSEDGRWYGATRVDGRFIRLFLDGRDARLAHRAASKHPPLTDADPSPLLEAVSTGGVAGMAGESFNDNYEMPMSVRERTTGHADGRPTIGEGDLDYEWRVASKDERLIVLARADGSGIAVAEISVDPVDGSASVRSARFADDASEFDRNAAAAYGLDEATWQSAPAWMRAYARLLFHGGTELGSYSDLESACQKLTGQPILPEEL
jgi:hypothetical protein